MYRQTYVDGHMVEFFISVMDHFEIFYGHRPVRMLHRSNVIRYKIKDKIQDIRYKIRYKSKLCN